MLPYIRKHTKTSIEVHLKLVILCCLLFIGTNTLATSKDTVFIPFKYELKYLGASVKIDQNYRYILEYLIETLKKDTSIDIHIRGHVCCGPGNKISRKRSKNVYRYLKQNGISKERITYKGYSNKIPAIFPEKSEEDEAKNRRVDFILYKTKR